MPSIIVVTVFMLTVYHHCRGDTICPNNYVDQSIELNQQIPCTSLRCLAKNRRLQLVQYYLSSALNSSNPSEITVPNGDGSKEENSNELRPERKVNRVGRVRGEFRKRIYATNEGPPGRVNETARLYYFNVAFLRPNYAITNATLSIRVHGSSTQNSIHSTHQSQDDHYELHIYTVSDDPSATDVPVIRKSVQLDDSPKWISIDVTQLAQLWLHRPSKNHGFLLKLKSLYGGDEANRTMDDMNRTTDVFLDVTYHSERNSMIRHLRNNTDGRTSCQGESSTGECCRYPLTIDFEALGFDFIIAPKRYNAYYCAGDCRVKRKRALSSSMTNSISPPAAATANNGNCCSAITYQDMKIIYISNKGSLEERTIVNAIIQQCGCS